MLSHRIFSNLHRVFSAIRTWNLRIFVQSQRRWIISRFTIVLLFNLLLQISWHQLIQCSMLLYNLTLQGTTAINCAVHGSFAGNSKNQVSFVWNWLTLRTLILFRKSVLPVAPLSNFFSAMFEQAKFQFSAAMMFLALFDLCWPSGWWEETKVKVIRHPGILL